MGITKNKITEFFCIIDDFCQEYDKEFLFQHFPQLQALLLFFMSRFTCTTCSPSNFHITALLNSSPESRL